MQIMWKLILGKCMLQKKSTAARNENVQNANGSFGKASSNLEPKVSMVKTPNKAEFKDQPVDTLPKPKMVKIND